MSKTKSKNTTHDIFNRAAKSFRMLGKEYKYEFIPSSHFQGVLLDLLAAMLSMDKVVENAVKHVAENLNPMESILQAQEATGDGDKEFNASVMEVASRLLKDRIYEIISDVLLYQNEEPFVSPERLSKTTRPLEVATFARIVMEDEELVAAVKEYIDGLGKLRAMKPAIQTTGP